MSTFVKMTEQSESIKKTYAAKEVYVLMQNDYRISRNIRAQWFFNHLNKVLQITPKVSERDCREEIEIISVVPKYSKNDHIDYNSERNVCINPETRVIFLATRYRLVFCLDLSPSVATVDVQHGTIFFDEVYPTLKQSLESVSKPFFVPGSNFYFVPQLHVTIIAHIPSCPSGVPQVLIQGWVLTSDNVNCLLEEIRNNLHEVAERVAKATAKVYEEHSKLKLSSGSIPATLIDDMHDGSRVIKTPPHVLTADISTLNLLRYGILALQLLPENSSAGIVVITDGVLSFPSTQMQDSLLAQLRNSTIACSFLQLGSPFHPFACFGRIPYKELMQFISTATCGAYFPSSVDINVNSELHELNAYHKAFLFWSFQNTRTPDFLEVYEPSPKQQLYWTVDNPHFYCVANQSRVRKKHTEGTMKVCWENVISCRLREGYTVKSVTIDDAKNMIEVKLLLPWNLSTNIEYIVTSSLNTSFQRKNISEIQSPSCRYELIVDGCYEFLHDVTCSDKKPIKSCYRAAVINQFWSYVKNLSHTDQILIQLHSFAHNPAYYTIPDSIKNGVPLFYLPVNSTTPVLSSKNVAHTPFTTFWKPLCMLDINVWHKWMHTHRVGIILQHDMPLAKNLHLPNSSGRYVHIQCRQATTALNSLLSDYSSFVLVENHSYIKFLFNEPDKPPTSFYVIRVTSKAPCMVIRLAFLGGLPGYQRNEIVKDLREKILHLKLLKPAKDHSSQSSDSSVRSPQTGIFDTKCCFLLKKPVEKILIRYERLPTNFMTSIVDSQFSIPGRLVAHQLTEHLATNMLITLSKYLHHQRWVWTMQCGPNTSLSLPTVSKILSVLTKIRLQQGFHFSHSSFGITYMVLEIPMKIHSPKPESEMSSEVNQEYYPCVVQYLLFPPHTNTTFKDSMSEEEDTELPEADGELQLISECWVEPQYGITSVPSSLKNLNEISYKDISQTLYAEDLECISALTTFEHLCMMCQKKENAYPVQQLSSISSTANDLCQSQMITTTSTPDVMLSQTSSSLQAGDCSIVLVPYSFNLMKLLSKCHQTELLFPTLYQVVSSKVEEEQVENSCPNDLLFEYLLKNLKLHQDRELILSVQDCMSFLHQVHYRERNLAKAPAVPFSCPEFHFSNNSTPEKKSPHQNLSRNPCYSKASIGISKKSDSKSTNLPEDTSVVEQNVPRWKCFLKGSSSTRFIITIIPATYVDLRKLMCNNTDSNINDNIKVLPDSLKQLSGNSMQTEPTQLSVIEKGESVYTSEYNESPKASSSFEQDNMKDSFEDKTVLTLPIYIYDCVMSSVTNQLVQRDEKPNCGDSYENHTFKYEADSMNIDDLVPERSDSEEYRKRYKKKPDKALLKYQRSLLDKAYSKAFVYAVYRSLVLDLHVEKFDVVAAIDEICEESLLEIDITEFVYMICGHVKDFTTKHSIRQMHLSSGITSNEKMSNGTDAQGAADTNQPHDKLHSKNFFPLALLLKHQPCEQLQQKHLDIKNKFSDILQIFLKKVPSRPDYYVFCPRVEEKHEVNECEAEYPETGNFDDGLNLPQNFVNFGDDHFENESNRGSNVDIPEEDVSLHSHLNTQSSFSSLDNDPDSSFFPNGMLSPPLFVHLSCSVRSKQDIKSCPMPSLPTCLGDVLDIIDPRSADFDLEELRITLDITCLTLPSDIESPVISHRRQCSTSFSSSSPVPESERYKVTIQEDDDESSSDNPTDTVQGGALQNIPSFQREGLYKCIDKIKWLLQDEKASAALDSYPITSDVLNMVATHVRNSEDKLCCLVKEVPLQFVFGPKSSLHQFVQVFQRMTLSGYHLNEVDNFYYLVLDAETAEKENRPFGSLDPPLGIAGKFQIVQQNPHCDDSTELKKICDETDNSHVFSNNEFAFLSRNFDLSGVDDDDTRSLDFLQLSKDAFNNKSAYNAGKDKRKFRQLCAEDDTETEDGNDQLQPKTRTSKKVSAKCSKEKERLGKRAMSTSSVMSAEMCSISRSAYSVPFNLHLLNSVCAAGGETRRGGPSNNTELSPDQLIEWRPEIPASSPVDDSSVWDLPLESRDSQSVSSVPSTAKFRIPDSTGSPHVYSDADFASVVGSCHFSNTEDGYDGDSSDTGSDWDWLNALDTRRPVLPKFWLIMTTEAAKVIAYFHIRHRKVEDEELAQSKAILTQVFSVITNICKEVNQTLLLQSLHETRMCNQLLVPEANDDIWKKNDMDPSTGSDPLRSISVEDDSTLAQVQEKYLEANLRFMPGAFNCDVVWITHFKLHHRLTSGQGSSFTSRGIQAFRTVLNSFSVNNRENMFVYQESSGSVFYLRLYEETCEENHALGKGKMEDNLSLSESCCSLPSMLQRKAFIENDFEADFRPRVNSGHSDTDHQDSMSNISISKKQQCIALYVHGIGEVGTEIKIDLVQVLQNRLNEGVLDMIIMMLTRNPLCKLTPEDVQFIQNPSQPPASEIHFTVPVKLLCYAHSIHVYLRQNMLHFLYNPKYTDSKKENHFKAYSRNPVEWSQVDDNDVFLYHSFQASGYSGSKGIACIVLSLVTGQGHPFQHLRNLPPNPSAYEDGLSENDFEELTSTVNYTMKKDRTPGPVALIRFQIWTVGKDSVEHIETRLHDAVRHALWDLLMEYRVLTAPVSEAVVQDDFSCYSEPTTPIRVRRTGRITVEQSFQLKDFSALSMLQNTKEMSSSVPDIPAKAQSPQSLNDVSIFKFNDGPKSAKAELYTEIPNQGNTSNSASPQVLDGDKNNLNHMFHSVMKPFLQFGDKLGCPTLSKHIFHLPSRHSVAIVLKEIQNIVKSLARDLWPRIFLRITNVLNADTEFVPFTTAYSSNVASLNSMNESEDLRPGTKKSFIIIGRNDKQWRSYMGINDFIKFHETYVDALKKYQRFPTHACYPSSSEKYHESTPASPTSISQTNSASGLSSPRLKSPVSHISDVSPAQGSVAFVPRQRLLLMFAQDKELTVFLYNWSQEVTGNLLKQLTKLIQWHDCRDALLSNIVVQKLGLFHGQTFPVLAEKSEKSKKIEFARKSSDGSVTITWNVAEQLFHHHSPPRDMQSGSATSKSSTVTSTSTSVLDILKNTRPPVPYHLSRYNTTLDPVKKHGMQLEDIRSAQRRDMQELHTMWQTRGTSFHYPYVDRLLLLLKRVARLSHYCLTPILFNPSWRWKVAPIRDHTLEPLESLSSAPDRSPSDSSLLSRSRHSSGSSIKNTDGLMNNNNNNSRSRRTSGTLPNSGQSSPKLRLKNPSEETWHHTVCSHYLQEYIQYLHTLGFVSLQTRENPHAQRRSLVHDEENIPKHSKTGSCIGSVSHSRGSMCGPPVFYLIKFLLGGLLVFEVGLCDPYAYGHLYTIECSRLHTCSTRTLSSQFTAAFLDELDKIKALMHLHSFTYDYHLRTIHSYISGRQLIFRHGYHLTSFLDDFIKYYQKSPNCARNLLYAGSLTITDTNMSSHQLYNYIISHNQLYGMTVLRMVPIIQDSSSMMDTEFVLVELSAHKASYKDTNDVCQMGSFDIGLLINHNTTDITADKNTLVLNYYIILTSQRELYPTLSNFGVPFGSFQTVRFGCSQASSGFSSRKTSTVSTIAEKSILESSGEETSSSSNESRSRKSTVRGMCDEEVTYLGYFSSQETMMQEVLRSQAQNSQTHLIGVVNRASIHCRRDFLWSSLLPRSAKDENSGRDGHGSTISYSEFSELLHLVSMVPLDDIDGKLSPFVNMHISWYKSLASVLKVKYADSYREFLCPEGNAHYVVVIHAKCPDAFMFLSTDLRLMRAELHLAFREPPTDSEHTLEKPNQRVVALQSLVEEFVNACCFHLWSGIIS